MCPLLCGEGPALQSGPSGSEQRCYTTEKKAERMLRGRGEVGGKEAEYNMAGNDRHEEEIGSEGLGKREQEEGKQEVRAEREGQEVIDMKRRGRK